MNDQMMRVLLLCLLALASCKKSEADAKAEATAARAQAGDNAPRITPERVTQGMQLSLGYAERVCKCAATDKSYEEECLLGRGRPEALKVMVRSLGGAAGPISTRERLEGEAGAEKIIAACVKADARLDPKKCSRY